MPFNDWEPLAPPASPSAEDDEFDGASGGVPPGWTETDFGSVGTITEDRQGLALTIPSTAEDDVVGIYKPILAGDGTWWTRISIAALRASTTRIGIVLWQDAASSAGDLAWFYLRTNGTDQAVVYATKTAYNAAASLVSTNNLSADSSVTHLWLRVRRTSTTYAMEWSTDGIGWSLLRSGTLTITPLHIGIGMEAPGVGATSVGRASFWRYVASDVGLTGLASGDRLSYDFEAAGAVALGELSAGGGAHVPEIASGAVTLEELYGGGTDFDVLGAGAADLAELTVSGVAVHELASSGAVDLGELTASGVAEHRLTTTGEAFLPALVAAGTAGRVVIASGAVDLGELTALAYTDATIGAATLGLLTAAGQVLVSAPPVGGDSQPPASGSGGVGGNAGAGGADICLDIDLGIVNTTTGVVTIIPQPVQLRLKARRRILSRTPSGYARATTLPGREAVIQWGESFLPVEDMAALRAYFAGRVNTVRWREPDGTVIQMRCRRDSFKTRWSWAQPGFYEPLVLTLTEMP